MTGNAYFTKSTFQFLKDLRANNDREWFAEHKHRYERQLKEPALRFIEAFAPELRKLSPHFMATPRSLFRIYRDTRFSKDKSPYKTAAGVHFRHEAAKDAHAPGFYVHIEPGACFVGLGIWHPDAKTLLKIRERIVDDPTTWKRVSRGTAFTGHYELEGDSLKRAPKGFDPDHPLIEDLRRKDFIGVRHVPQSFITNPGLPRELADTFQRGVPLVRFLCDAVGVAF